jgi:ribonuclease HII
MDGFRRRRIVRGAGLHAYDDALVRSGLGPVAGIDEAGRGACAGPLVVAAVTLGHGRSGRIAGLDDSKALTASRRERLFVEVMGRAAGVSVVVVSPTEVDRLGVHVADLQAMRRALARLGRRPGYVLTDGFPVDGLGVPGLAVWKGDQVSASVAAASIVAKVTRDRLMVDLAGRWPGYGFDGHKGYVTAAHLAALDALGPCPEHRRSFAPVARPVGERDELARAEGLPEGTMVR